MSVSLIMNISLKAEPRNGTVKPKLAVRRNGVRFGAGRRDDPSRTPRESIGKNGGEADLLSPTLSSKGGEEDHATPASGNGEGKDIQKAAPAANGHAEPSSLTEIIKSLLRIARELV